MHLPKLLPLCLLLTLTTWTAQAQTAATRQAWGHHLQQSTQALNRAQTTVTPASPLPAGANELRFSEIFEPVIGDRGPTYTPRFRQLHQQTVRISGFMVAQSGKRNGLFLFAPFPTKIENDGFCLNEDFPPCTLHVQLADGPDHPVPFLPGRITLTGTLLAEPTLMPDGRNAIAVLQITSASLPGSTSLAVQP